jgi:hypothetical protein
VADQRPLGSHSFLGTRMSDEWPVLRSKPGPTDDEIEFQNDLAHMRALVDAVIDRIIERDMPL